MSINIFFFFIVVFTFLHTLVRIIIIKIQKRSARKWPKCYMRVMAARPVCAFTKLPWPSITKTCLYNFDPLKPHFYIVKLGFTGYTLFFLFLLKTIDCWHSLEPPHWGGSNEYPQCTSTIIYVLVLTSTHNLCFEQKYVKYESLFFFWFFLDFLYIWKGVFSQCSPDYKFNV